MDELCISWRHNLWLWTAVSRYTGQVLAWFVGSRSWDCLEDLWGRMPRDWKRRLVYTDGYGAYFAFFASWQHRVCEKFDGGTTTVEGVNHALRHRCGALVRKTSARCRSLAWLERRIAITVQAHNRGGRRRLKRRIKTMLKKR
jgi:insertion element IS1 protein InsB